MKIVHAADLHVDSPMRGLARYEGAPIEAMRGATRQAVENLVELCLDEGAKLLLLAGDVFDGDWKDYSTGLFFARQMARLREGDVQVVWLRGNHDAMSQVTKHLRLPENVVELSHRKAETRRFEALGVAVHGQGFTARTTREDLAARYPDALSGWLNVGLLHTSLNGREGHDPYAPTDVATLASKGYDYWALGHVHQREVVSRDPWVVYPGNLQGRHARETGAKGATLITVADGRIAEVEHRVLDAARWCVVEVDSSEASTVHDVSDLLAAKLSAESVAADGRPLAVRVRIVGRSAAHEHMVRDREALEASLRAAALDAGGEVWLEKVELASEPAIDTAALSERDDAIGQIARALQSLKYDETRLAALADAIGDLKLPAEVRRDGWRVDEPSAIAALLPEVEQLLIARLLNDGGQA